MNKNRKVMKALIAAFAIGVIAFGGKYAVQSVSAYLTDDGQVVNELSPGNGDITVRETFPPEIKTTPNPDPHSQSNVKYQKTVRIENTGSTPQYIRVFLNFSDDYARDHSKITAGGKTYAKFDDMAADYAKHTSGWVYVPSGSLGGYFYYASAVNPGGKTDPLCDNIETVFEKDSKITDYSVFVSSESVQTQADTGAGTKTGAGVLDWRTAWTTYLNK